MSLRNFILSGRAVWPVLKRALVSGQFFRPQCELTEPHPDVLCEYNVKVPVEDGIVLTANVFRSRHAQEQRLPAPVVMSAHPYNNQLTPALGTTPFGGPPLQYRLIPQSGRPRFSALTSWEAPDPSFWVPAGYAVVNLNLPGYGTSGGPPGVFTERQAKSCYEAIEWVARQSWCSGKVGMSGVSYHAIAQYHVAACQHYGGPPPALRCISPWEGFADTYREIACPGGLDDRGFGPFWWMMEVKPALNGLTADFLKFNECLPSDYIQLHPFYDDFWREMTAKLEQINIPMLVCASFSDHGLHTAGSFRAFVKARSRHKWVYTHRTGKWDAYYSPEVQQLTKEFMDCFLKDDTASGFLTRPPVRLEVRSNRDVIHEIRHEEAWPLTRTEYTKFFLSIIPRKLDLEKNPTSQAIAYSAKRGRASFRIRLDKDTELTGHMKLRLWVQAKATPGSSLPPPDDMAIFVAVNKRDRQGRAVPFFGSVGNRADMVTRGFCRVSRRELDFNESTNYEPVITGTAHEPLEPNQIVPVDIALYPSSTFFAAGETLELIISSNEIIPSPPYIKDVRFNRGKHVIFCGGDYDSYLLVPNIPVPSPDAGRPEKP